MAKTYQIPDEQVTAEVRELVLFAENHYPWYRDTYLHVKKNLAGKMRRGVYVPEKAAVAWGHALRIAAGQYAMEYGSFVPRGSLAAVLREAGTQFEEQERATLLEEG